MKVSIVIPTYNGAATLDGCLRAVFAQWVPWPFDVHVVDSGSTDATLAIAARYPVALSHVAPGQFSHGGTRHAAAQATAGELVAFLVQDAEPIGRHWLATLVDAVETYAAAGAFGAQVPRPHASPYARYAMAGVLPRADSAVVKSVSSADAWAQLAPRERFERAFFHHANACVRRSALDAVPLRDVPYGEDMDWAARVLVAGGRLVYEPQARVLHAHDRPIGYTFRRAYADHALVAGLFGWRMIPRTTSVAGAVAWAARDAARWVRSAPDPRRAKPGMYARILSHAAAQALGAYLGARSTPSEGVSRKSGDVRLDRLMRRGV